MSDTVLKRRAMPNVAPVLQLGFTMRLQKIGLNPTLLAGLILLTLVVLAAMFSALIVRERINKLDLVAVLKTRD